MKILTYERGQVVFHEDAVVKSIYIVYEGEFELEKKLEHEVVHKMTKLDHRRSGERNQV